MLFVSHTFLEDLGLIFCVAAITTVLFQSIRQPVVVGYLVAGMAVGPHTRIPLFADSERLHAVSELGVILLMFALGLEFSIRKLLRLGPTSGFITALQVGLMLWLGYVTGRAMGWTELESVFTGALLSISSTTIVAKAFGEESISERVRDLVFGVLLAEDLTAVMLLAVLTAMATGAGLTATMMMKTIGQLAGFLAILVGVGMLIVPRAIRAVVRLGRPETTLVACIGVCFAFAIAAEHAGYSVALGAFLAGSLVAESGDTHSIEHLVAPVRDMFGAVFFVSVGMMIDPALIAEHWVALSVLVTVVIVGKFFGVTIAAMLSGIPVTTSVQAGMSLTQIGEFSFIIAGLGIKTHATREFVYTLAVAVSAITTFTTPFLIRASGPFATFIARRVIPQSVGPLQAIYGAATERMRERGAWRGAVARPALLIGTSALAIASILILNEMDPLDITTALSNAAAMTYFRAGLIVDLGALLLCAPFGVGMYAGARSVARTLAARALPHAAVPDEGAAASEALVAVFQATILLVVVMPMLAAVQPFLEPVEGIGAIAVGTILMAIVVARSAHKMQGQTRTIVRIVTAALAGPQKVPAPQDVPGIGVLTPITIAPGAPAIGRTLAEIDLPAATGATAIALARSGDGVIVPTGVEVLQEGDVLELVGPSAHIEAARALLLKSSPTSQSRI